MKPAAIHPGARIALISPASYATDERVEQGMAALRKLGYEPVLSQNARAPQGPLNSAGSMCERFHDFHQAFRHEEEMVMCLRGGYGSNELLPGYNADLIAERPKPFFAYSDLTGLQLSMLDRTGLPVFHGPMAATDFCREDGVHRESFLAAIEGRLYGVGAGEGLRTLQPGTARGTLYGGCLSILCAMIGTPWEPKTEGKLLFLEDVGEPPYRIARMLWQLRRAGKFEEVKGIVFGEMPGCGAPEQVEEAIRSALVSMELPIGFGLRSGHASRENVTLTLGVEAELKLENKARLELREAAVSA